MKDENAFNSYLSREFKKNKGLVCLKMAEKYHVGIPDFSLWYRGRNVVVECKFIPGEVPKGKSVLKHPFSGPQRTFLHTILSSDNLAFGLIGMNYPGMMYLIPADLILPSGTWSYEEFQVLRCSAWAPAYSFGSVDGLVRNMFAYTVKDGVCQR